MKKLLLLALLLVATAPAAFAADDDGMEADTPAGKSSPDLGGKKIIYRKKTAVSFDDAVVEGTANNPEGVYVVTPPPQTFGGLLKLRPNFHRELMRDALLLK
jgi:hypothetical protein